MCFFVTFLPDEDDKKREKMGGPWAVSASSQSQGMLLLYQCPLGNLDICGRDFIIFYYFDLFECLGIFDEKSFLTLLAFRLKFDVHNSFNIDSNATIL